MAAQGSLSSFLSEVQALRRSQAGLKLSGTQERGNVSNFAEAFS